MQREAYVVGRDKEDAVRGVETSFRSIFWKVAVARVIADNENLTVFAVPITIDLADIRDLD